MSDYFEDRDDGGDRLLQDSEDVELELDEIDRRLKMWARAEQNSKASPHIVFAKGLTIQRRLDTVREQVEAAPELFGDRFERRMQGLQRRIDGYVGTLRAASMMHDRLRTFDESYWTRQLQFGRWLTVLNVLGVGFNIWLATQTWPLPVLEGMTSGAIGTFGAGAAAAVFALVLLHLGAMKSAIEMLPRLSGGIEDEEESAADERRRLTARKQILRWQTVGTRLNATALVLLMLASGYIGFGLAADQSARAKAAQEAAETRWEQLQRHRSVAPSGR